MDNITKRQLLLSQSISMSKGMKDLISKEWVLFTAELDDGSKGRRAVAELARLWLGEAVEGKAGGGEGAKEGEDDAWFSLLLDILLKIATLGSR